MIKKEDCLMLGSIAKPHGIRGSVLIWLRDIKAQDIKKTESVFLEIDGLLVPFFIESTQMISQESIILKIEGILSATQAKSFAGYPVYILPDKIKTRKKTFSDATALSGFKVTDINLGLVGIASEIARIANNPLLKVIHKEQEFLIPLHEEIILDIDYKKKEIIIRAPDGLFEI